MTVTGEDHHILVELESPGGEKKYDTLPASKIGNLPDGKLEVGTRWAFDESDPAKTACRAEWKERRLETEEASSGETLFDVALESEGALDFVLLDPYDLFDHWGSWLPRMQRAAQRAPVLAYLYNKSPRGAGHEDQYRRFRHKLEQLTVESTGALMGRLAADAIAPRAYHEVVLLADRPWLTTMQGRLRQITETLAAALACDRRFTCFEEIPSSPPGLASSRA